LKLVNSTKIKFRFAGLNLNLLFRKKAPENALFMDDALKTKRI